MRVTSTLTPMGARYCTRHKLKTFKLKSVFQTEDRAEIFDIIVSARCATLQARIDAVARFAQFMCMLCKSQPMVGSNARIGLQKRKTEMVQVVLSSGKLLK